MEAVYCFPRPYNNRHPLSSSRFSALCIYVSMAVCQQLRQPVPFQLSRSLVRPSTAPGSCVGSLLGCSCVFQESSHVQQSILYSLGKLGSVRLLTAVEGRDGDVDVLIHGIVTHSVAIWHHRTKAHHAVCLRANLDSPQTDTRQQIIICSVTVVCFSGIQKYLAGVEIIMLSHSKRRIHEYPRHRCQVFNTQHLQPEQVSVNSLPVDCLTK